MGTDSHRSDTDTLIRVDGSSTLYPAVNALAEAFMRRYPQYRIEAAESGSGAGIAHLLKGRADVVPMSRPLKADEIEIATAKNITLESYQVGFDGILVVTHPSRFNRVTRLSMAQLRDIFFTGRVHDWSQLDSHLKGPIHVYGRLNNSSGTGSLFTKKVMGTAIHARLPGIHTIDTTQDLITAIAGDPDGIGYASSLAVDDSVRALKITNEEGYTVSFTSQTILTRRYPLSRILSIVTSQPASEPIELFLDFALSRDGQSLLAQRGIVTIR